MLVELVVENYAVVERARVRFHRGLNLLTGETGSGKSIVVDSLGLLFGGRASAEVIRTGADRARLSGIFELPASVELRKKLEEAGVEVEDGELLIEREILAGGKSRAFAGSRPATAALLREIAPFLGDIHGQHEQQRLFSADAQREILDTFAGCEAAVNEVVRIYADWRVCATELDDLDRREQEQLRLADLWNFQKREIEQAELKAGEDESLEQERRVQMNVQKLSENAQAAYDALYDAQDSAAALLKVAAKRLADLAKIDSTLVTLAEQLKPAMVAVEDVSHELRGYLGKLEADPQRLEDIEERLSAIDKLKRKYGSSIAEILEFLEDVRAKTAAVENASEYRAGLEKKRQQLASAYESAAMDLSKKRADAARRLEKKVETELAGLAMGRTTFRIQITRGDWTAEGVDTVVFQVSANVGEEPRPLEKVASGGELSRIALALKTCAAVRGGRGVPRTLVFDEVDAGIGGATAETVGRRLKQLAGDNQVLCVTHQPQIAGFADHHYRVEKREAKGRTVAAIEELDFEERTREIGRMLSGQKLTPEALKNAEQLIRTSVAS